MKKFFISLLILIIAAGVVFYFGWVQIEIPPDHYAVIFTKTGGYDDTPIQPGEFTWRWEKLFPTNMTIYTFPLHSRTSDISISGSLPSADEYETVLQVSDVFSYEIVLTVTYRLKPDELPGLIQKGTITPETSESLFESMENSAASVLSRFLYTSITENKPFYDFLDDIEKVLGQEFPAVEFLSINPKKIKFPDTDLYISAKKTYLSILDTRNRIFTAETERAALTKAASMNRIETLRQYGELLTEYPIILEYLALGLDQEFLFESLGVEEAE